MNLSAQKILAAHFVGKIYAGREYHDDPGSCAGLRIKRIWIGLNECCEDGVIHLELEGGNSTWVYGNEGIKIDSEQESKKEQS